MARNEWRPHAKQEKALLSTAFETLYGGARGGGKTDAGMAWMLYPIEIPKYRGLVIRKNSIDLNDWISRARLMYSGTGAIFAGNEIRFPSGSVIITGHLKDKDAYSKYLGHEYQRILIEELTLIPTEESYLKLISSCRSTVPGLDPRIFATTNPGNVGHFWVKKRFVDPAPPEQAFKDSISGRLRIYIPATVEDNPVLMEADPEYVLFLDSLAPDLKAQWRKGSWENQKIKGAYWADEMEQAREYGRICPVAILPDEPTWVYWDLGINDLQVAWFVQFRGEQIRLFKAISDSSKGYSYYVNLLGEIAEEMKLKYRKMVLPHDGGKRSPDTLRSFKDELELAVKDPTKEWANYEVDVIPRTSDKRRDIQTARTIFPRCLFDNENLDKGLEALMGYRREWAEDRGTFSESPYHDWTSNFADGFMAMAVSLPSMKPKENLEEARLNYQNSGSIKTKSPIPGAMKARGEDELKRAMERYKRTNIDSSPF